MIINHLIFDLDDTLYTSSSKMTDVIAFNMINFVAEYFKISYDEAKILRKQKIAKYGSTLEWLMDSGMNDYEAYFAAVHHKDETDNLEMDTKLRPFLQSLNIPMSILTNAPREHAERVLDFFGIQDLFSSITDIRKCNLKGKPYPESFNIALSACNGTIEDSLFIDDQEKYVLGFKNLGGTSAHIKTKPGAYQTGIIPDFLEKPSALSEKGKVFPIPSIYELPNLLKQLTNL